MDWNKGPNAGVGSHYPKCPDCKVPLTVPLLQLVEEEEVSVGKYNQKKYVNSDCLLPIMSRDGRYLLIIYSMNVFFKKLSNSIFNSILNPYCSIHKHLINSKIICDYSIHNHLINSKIICDHSIKNNIQIKIISDYSIQNKFTN